MITLLISSFRRVQNVVCFLLSDSPASDLYMPTFRNTLSVPSSKAGVKSHLSLKMEQIECSETSAYINQTPGNHPKENKQHTFNIYIFKVFSYSRLSPSLYDTAVTNGTFTTRLKRKSTQRCNDHSPCITNYKT